MQQLFFDKNHKCYYLVCSKDDLNVYCSNCEKIIPLHSHIFIHRSFSKTEYIKELLCDICIKEHKKRIYDEFYPAEVIDIIPPSASIVPDFPPSLRAGSSSNIFTIKEVEKMMKDGEHITNRCRVAFDENRNKMVDYKEYKLEEAEELEAERRKHLTIKELDKELNIISQSQPVISETKKKMIGMSNESNR